MSAPARVACREKDCAEQAFARDVIAGLTAQSKRLAPKYFYDEAGSALFERITELPEYYPTRCELAILDRHAAEMAGLIDGRTALIEFGSGSARKARILLAASTAIAAYVPVDISSEMLVREAAQLQHDFPRLNVIAVAADFTRPFHLPNAISGLARTGFFPGSTIGNFDPQEAAAFLQHAASMLGPRATLIIGVDLIKDSAILDAAYDDAAGVTAEFNLNLLARINRELGADFDLEAFRHQAFYNAERRRIEMHLISRNRQTVNVCGHAIRFRAGESIHTENSYKYTIQSFHELARRAGWNPVAVWTDPKGWFSVHALSAQQSQAA
ncbi:MAG TPA: L-histidine N(alpha)-methyltransferase [Xanthobacteraceae bacterium]|jgi:dimethylhistidine N-methyltransferase